MSKRVLESTDIDQDDMKTPELSLVEWIDQSAAKLQTFKDALPVVGSLDLPSCAHLAANDVKAYFTEIKQDADFAVNLQAILTKYPYGQELFPILVEAADKTAFHHHFGKKTADQLYDAYRTSIWKFLTVVAPSLVSPTGDFMVFVYFALLQSGGTVNAARLILWERAYVTPTINSLRHAPIHRHLAFSVSRFLFGGIAQLLPRDLAKDSLEELIFYDVYIARVCAGKTKFCTDIAKDVSRENGVKKAKRGTRESIVLLYDKIRQSMIWNLM